MLGLFNLFIKWVNGYDIILELTLASVRFQQGCKPDEDLGDIGIFCKFYTDENMGEKKLVVRQHFK